MGGDLYRVVEEAQNMIMLEVSTLNFGCNERNIYTLLFY